MNSLLKRVCTFVLASSIVLSSVATTDVFADKKEYKQQYPILNEYLKSKYKTTLKSNKDGRLRMIVRLDESKKSKAKSEILKISGVKLKYEYDSLFKGLAIDIDSSKVSELKKIDGILDMKESERLIPQMFNAKELTKVIEAKSKYSNKYNLDGRGMVIATLDSGVEINHPDMRIDDDAVKDMKIKDIKKPFTNKVPFGFNYFKASHDDLKDNVAKPHGMHIAGILAGNSKDSNGFKGIAPNAQLLVYKVITYDRKGPGADPNEIEYIGEDAQYHAMEDAVRRGADVISLSIGAEGSGRSDDIWNSAVENAYKKGVIVVAAMGNWAASNSESSYDTYADSKFDRLDNSSTVSVAANPNAIGVGSTKNIKLRLPKVKIGDLTMPYSDLSKHNVLEKTFNGKVNIPTDELKSKLVFVKRGMGDDDLSSEKVKGKVVIATRGGEDVKVKAQRFLKKGAIGFILVNDVTDWSRGDYQTLPVIGYEHLTIPEGWAISISKNNGDKLLKMLDEEVSMKFDTNLEDVQVLDNTGVSGYSSWGPNYDLEIKPDIVAPGENILSTSNNGYHIMSGTSMSAPHIAGTATLLLEKLRPIQGKKDYLNKINIADLSKIILMNTSDVLKDYDSESKLEYSPRRQGSGQVNLDKAFSSDVILTYGDNKGSASLKEISDKTKFKLKLTNFSDSTKVFNIDSSKVLTQTTENRKLQKEDSSFDGKTLHEKILDKANLSHPSYIKVAANSSVDIEFELDATAAKNQFVEGYIYLKSKDKSQPDISIPYMGFKGSWSDENILDKPQWENDSITKLVTLKKFVKEDDHENITVFEQLGTKKKLPNGEMVDDPETFSMNSISNKIFPTTVTKKVAPTLIFLRETQTYDVSIVDKKDDNVKPLRVLNTDHYPKKYIENEYMEYGEDYQKEVQNADKLSIWDGRIYDPSTGKLKDAQEGQYYFRIRCRRDEKSPYQVTYIPIKVDNSASALDLSVDKDNDKVVVDVNDNEGIEYIGATINNKKVELKSEGHGKYSIDIPKDNLTTSSLRVEAMDYAGNPVSKVVKLNEKYSTILNKDEVESKKSNVLKLKLSSEVEDVSAKLSEGNDKLKVSKKSDAVEIELNNLKDKDNIVELGYKLKDGEKFTEKQHLDLSKKSAKSENYDNEDLEDDEEDEDEGFDPSTIGIINGHYLNFQLANKHDNVELNDSDDVSYKVEMYLKSNQKAIVENINTYYNQINNEKDQYKPLNTLELEGEDDYAEDIIPIKEGDNSIKIKVVDTETGKVLFDNKYIVFLDTHAPVVTFSSNVSLDENLDDIEPGNSVTGKIFANADESVISGFIEDNMDSWEMKINEDLVDRGGLLGHFGNNQKPFLYKFKANAGEIVKVKFQDGSGNEKSIELEIVRDDEKPSITVKNKDKLIAENPLEYSITDDNLETTSVMINGKEYEKGKPIKDYALEKEAGKYLINITATDKAGNKSEKTINIGNVEKKIPKFELKKSQFTIEELENVENLVDLKDDVKANIIEKHEKSKNKWTVRISFTDKFGQKEEIEYDVDIIEKSQLKEDKTLDRKLKKDKFFADEVSEDELFDLKDDESLIINQKLDVTKPATIKFKARFIKGDKYFEREYEMTILDELKASLKKNDFTFEEISDINNVIEFSKGATAKYLQKPEQKLGEQKIKVEISMGTHKKEFEFTINLIEKKNTPDTPGKPDEPNTPDTPGKPDSKDDTDKPNPEKLEKIRIFGKDRIQTAIEISKKTYDKSNSVVLVGSTATSDALSVALFAKEKDAPILLTEKAQLSKATFNEITRLKAKNIYIIGGKNSVSNDVEKELQKSKLSVYRIEGKDRFETSRKILENIKSNDKSNIFIANGMVEIDALSISPVSYANDVAVILTNGNSIDNATEKILTGYSNKTVVGGSNSVSNKLQSKMKAKRISGKDRFETSYAINQMYFKDAKVVCIANGINYIDSLTGAYYAGKQKAPIYLVEKDSISKQVTKSIQKSNKLVIFGGENSISEKAIR